MKAAMSGIDVQTLAEATDIPVPVLNDRLSGRSPFEMSELVDVGGFLHFPPEQFLKGVTP